MGAVEQTLRLAGKEFVVIPAGEYRRLKTLAQGRAVDAVGFARRSIGRDLAARRRAAGFKQAELAARAGVRAETISRLENGHGNPTVSTVRKLLRALGESS